MEFVSADLEEDIISRIFRIYNAARVRITANITYIVVSLFSYLLNIYCVTLCQCSKNLEYISEQNRAPDLMELTF